MLSRLDIMTVDTHIVVMPLLFLGDSYSVYTSQAKQLRLSENHEVAGRQANNPFASFLGLLRRACSIHIELFVCHQT